MLVVELVLVASTVTPPTGQDILGVLVLLYVLVLGVPAIVVLLLALPW